MAKHLFAAKKFSSGPAGFTGSLTCGRTRLRLVTVTPIFACENIQPVRLMAGRKQKRLLHQGASSRAATTVSAKWPTRSSGANGNARRKRLARLFVALWAQTPSPNEWSAARNQSAAVQQWCTNDGSPEVSISQSGHGERIDERSTKRCADHYVYKTPNSDGGRTTIVDRGNGDAKAEYGPR